MSDISTILLPTRAWLRRGVVTATTEAGMTLVNTAGEMFHLNASGQLAIQVLRRGGETAAAVTALSDRYGLSRERAENDLAQLLDQMAAAKLLRTR